MYFLFLLFSYFFYTREETQKQQNKPRNQSINLRCIVALQEDSRVHWEQLFSVGCILCNGYWTKQLDWKLIPRSTTHLELFRAPIVSGAASLHHPSLNCWKLDSTPFFLRKTCAPRTMTMNKISTMSKEYNKKT